MKLYPLSAPVWVWYSAAFALMTCSELRVAATGLKLEAQLVWGTNDETSPNPKHKPVEAEIKRKLSELPLKWSNYFEVTRKSFEVAPASLSKVTLSEKCGLEVRCLAGSKIEVTLVGKGKETLRRTQDLPRGEILVLGGNAPNATAWLVVLKRIE